MCQGISLVLLALSGSFTFFSLYAQILLVFQSHIFSLVVKANAFTSVLPIWLSNLTVWTAQEVAVHQEWEHFYAYRKIHLFFMGCQDNLHARDFIICIDHVICIDYIYVQLLWLM